MNKVIIKLGISAPKEITILRKELLDALKQSNLDAAQMAEKNFPLPKVKLKKIKPKDNTE